MPDEINYDIPSIPSEQAKTSSNNFSKSILDDASQPTSDRLSTDLKLYRLSKAGTGKELFKVNTFKHLSASTNNTEASVAVRSETKDLCSAAITTVAQFSGIILVY